MPERTHLPDRLHSGDLLQTKTGHQLIVVETSERDHFDQPLYRFRHPAGSIGHLLHSRDQLDEDGVVLVKPQT